MTLAYVTGILLKFFVSVLAFWFVEGLAMLVVSAVLFMERYRHEKNT